MCWPQPAHVTLLHFSQVAGAHIGFLLLVSLFLCAKQFGEEAWFFRVVFVALATLSLWNATHYLVNVLAAAAPRGFATFAAFNCTAHIVSLSFGFLLVGAFKRVLTGAPGEVSPVEIFNVDAVPSQNLCCRVASLTDLAVNDHVLAG